MKNLKAFGLGVMVTAGLFLMPAGKLAIEDQINEYIDRRVNIRVNEVVDFVYEDLQILHPGRVRKNWRFGWRVK